MTRAIWLITGLAWAARSLLEFAQPEYYAPQTILDWTAVWLYTAALLLFAPSILLLAGLASSRTATAVAVVSAFGAVVAGIANALEDGFGLQIGGTPYVVGFLLAWGSLVPLGVTLWRGRRLPLAALAIAMFFGILFAFGRGGGLIVLAAYGSLAIAPSRFGRSADGAPATTPRGWTETRRP